MEQPPLEAHVAGVAALSNPLSRQAYELAVQWRWVSKDTVAEVLDVARSVAAFHLDKLVDAGLLTTRFERVSGRTGPGAGRPAKLYGRSDLEIEVSLPPRRYDLAGSLLASAVARSSASGEPVGEAVAEVARDAGSAVGKRARRSGGLVGALAMHGYEPQEDNGGITLVNCPFHALADEHRGLVCGMNLDFLSGVLDGLGERRRTAVLDPAPGFCCVRIRTG
jgi:predicted ArsR family transcriptional regulator